MFGKKIVISEPLLYRRPMTAFVFFIFKSAGEGEGWFEGDSTWLFIKKNHQNTQIAIQLYC
jgi:hypothetical protein